MLLSSSCQPPANTPGVSPAPGLCLRQRKGSLGGVGIQLTTDLGLFGGPRRAFLGFTVLWSKPQVGAIAII